MTEPREKFVEPEIVKHEEKLAEMTEQPPLGSVPPALN
jgi:hypothetical protein